VSVQNVKKESKLWFVPVQCKHCNKVLSYFPIDKKERPRSFCGIDLKNIVCKNCFPNHVQNTKKVCRVVGCRNSAKHYVDVSVVNDLAVKRCWYCEEHKYFIQLHKAIDTFIEDIPIMIKDLEEITGRKFRKFA